jgi:hypothetical protein
MVALLGGEEVEARLLRLQPLDHRDRSEAAPLVADASALRTTVRQLFTDFWHRFILRHPLRL